MRVCIDSSLPIVPARHIYLAIKYSQAHLKPFTIIIKNITQIYVIVDLRDRISSALPSNEGFSVAVVGADTTDKAQ